MGEESEQSSTDKSPLEYFQQNGNEYNDILKNDESKKEQDSPHKIKKSEVQLMSVLDDDGVELSSFHIDQSHSNHDEKHNNNYNVAQYDEIDAKQHLNILKLNYYDDDDDEENEDYDLKPNTTNKQQIITESHSNNSSDTESNHSSTSSMSSASQLS